MHLGKKRSFQAHLPKLSINSSPSPVDNVLTKHRLFGSNKKIDNIISQNSSGYQPGFSLLLTGWIKGNFYK